jgi:hypothetical protein
MIVVVTPTPGADPNLKLGLETQNKRGLMQQHRHRRCAGSWKRLHAVVLFVPVLKGTAQHKNFGRLGRA